MNRKDARMLAVATLTELGMFDAVLSATPDTMKSPVGATYTKVAIVSSRSMRHELITNGRVEITSDLVVSVAVRRAADGGSDAEDLLDDLVRSALVALYRTDSFTIQPTTATPPRLRIDGALFRVEHIPLSVRGDTLAA